MTPLDWLFELPRIAQQDDTPRGWRDGENVRERHLGGFVDKEYVDDTRRVGAGPEPGGRTSDHAVGIQSIEKRRVVRREAQSRQIVLLFGRFLDAFDRKAL